MSHSVHCSFVKYIFIELPERKNFLHIQYGSFCLGVFPLDILSICNCLCNLKGNENTATVNKGRLVTRVERKSEFKKVFLSIYGVNLNWIRKIYLQFSAKQNYVHAHYFYNPWNMCSCVGCFFVGRERLLTEDYDNWVCFKSSASASDTSLCCQIPNFVWLSSIALICDNTLDS